MLFVDRGCLRIVFHKRFDPIGWIGLQIRTEFYLLERI
jgi:hypothetical protein